MLKTLFCIILFFSLIGEFQLQAQESAYPLRTVKQSGRSWVYLRDIAAYYGMKPSVKGKVFTASAKDKKLKITQNLRKFYINDVVVDLSFACSKVNGQLVIAKEDFQLTIDPIFRSWALPKHRLKTIVIDPGHGGKDSGARGSKVYEKDVVLKAGRMLKTRLEKYGFNVIMTRNSDHYLTLTKRGDFKGDLFISLHCNSATAKSAKGFEIWYCTPKGMKAFGKHDVLSRSVAGNHMNPNNVNLAYEIQKYVIRAVNPVDRGIKRNRWKVLAQYSQPAVLIEFGFLSNAQEQDKLINSAYMNRMMDGVRNGILSYYNSIHSKPKSN